MNDAVHATAAPKAVGSYPHARRVGNLLFLSGIGPRDPATNAIAGNEYFADGRVRRYDIEAQARAVFANVRAVLEASGARWEDLASARRRIRPARPAAPPSASPPCRRRSRSSSSASPCWGTDAMLPNPINLQAWIDEHRHLLKPPVGNKCIVDDHYIVMIVGGPNARTDYHFEDGPEWFYQLEGEMVLRIQEDFDGKQGAARDIRISAGEMSAPSWQDCPMNACTPERGSSTPTLSFFGCARTIAGAASVLPPTTADAAAIRLKSRRVTCVMVSSLCRVKRRPVGRICRGSLP